MFDGIEDYDFNGNPKKDNTWRGLLIITICLILFGVFLGWLIFSN